MALAVVEVELHIPADHSLDSPGSFVAFHSQDLADSLGLVHNPPALVQAHNPHSSADHKCPLGQMRFESHWSGRVCHGSLELLSVGSEQTTRPASVYTEGYPR